MTEEILEIEKVEMSPERALIQRRFGDSSTPMLVYVFTDLILSIPLLLTGVIPGGWVTGAACLAGAFIITVMMSMACVAGYDENNVCVQSLLIFFPVDAKKLHRELLLHMWKHIGIQLLVTAIPMLLIPINFQLVKLLKVLGTTFLTMLVIGLLFVWGSMSLLKATEV